MEITPWMLYLVFQLDAFKEVFGWWAFISLVCGIGIFFWGTVDRCEAYHDDERWVLGCKKQTRSFLLLIPFTLFFMGSFMAPSTKTALMIWTIPPIANNEQVQKLPTKLVDALNGYLDQYIKK